MKVLLNIFLILIAQVSKADFWTQKADFPDGTRKAPFSFSIGSKGYTGCGSTNNNNTHFWEYDSFTNVWTQKADFIGASRIWSTGFSVLNKGYAGLGNTPFGLYLQDFYEYDPASNSWTQKANFPGSNRAAAMSFSVGNKGYIFGGGTPSPTFHACNDLWEYDPLFDSWIQLVSLPALPRFSGIGFSLSGKAYVGIGLDTSGFLLDFWEYDFNLALWTQKSNFPGSVRSDPAFFAIDNMGYVGIGEFPVAPFAANDFWSYDPLTNQWSQKLNFAGFRREEASFFSIGNKGYIGLGTRDAPPSNAYVDFWEYTPDSTTSIQVLNKNDLQINVFPNPVNDKLNIYVNISEPAEIIIYDISSRIIMRKNFTNATSLNFEKIQKGIYLYEVLIKGRIYKKGKVIKN